MTLALILIGVLVATALVLLALPGSRARIVSAPRTRYVAMRAPRERVVIEEPRVSERIIERY